MPGRTSRRAVLGLGAGVATALGLGLFRADTSATEATPRDISVSAPHRKPYDADNFAAHITKVVEAETVAAGGWWKLMVSIAGANGEPVTAIAREPDATVQAWSTNKLPVAIALLDKVDKGESDIDDRVEVSAELISDDNEGLFCWDDAYPSQVTLGHVLAAMLTISDNTATRLCGAVIDAPAINQYWMSRGFSHTQVESAADPRRFWMGTTTPREQHDVWRALAAGDLLSGASTERLLRLLRAPVAYNEGFRLHLSTQQRGAVATKAGWFDSEGEDERAECGIVFDDKDVPLMTYSVYSGGHGVRGDFGYTHPAVRARANIGQSIARYLSRVSLTVRTSTLCPQRRK